MQCFLFYLHSLLFALLTSLSLFFSLYSLLSSLFSSLFSLFPVPCSPSLSKNDKIVFLFPFIFLYFTYSFFLLPPSSSFPLSFSQEIHNSFLSSFYPFIHDFHSNIMTYFTSSLSNPLPLPLNFSIFREKKE